MIIAIVGNIGTGKTVTTVKRIIDSNKMCFVNFDVKADNVVRLKKEHIIKEEIIGYNKKGVPKKELKVNWEFWNKALKKYKDYHIYMDEMQNIVHSRKSMTHWNTLMSMWISQIRKIIGTSEKTHIYLVSQKLNRIDIAFRDLLHCIIHCEKVEKLPYIPTVVYENGQRKMKMLPTIWILQYYFTGNMCIENYQNFLYRGLKKYRYATGFIANPYFEYYDSYEIFGETAYL